MSSVPVTRPGQGRAPVWARRGKQVDRPRLAKSEQYATALASPICPRCQNATIWRGRWVCDGCHSRIGWTEYEGGHHRPPIQPPHALPAGLAAGAPLFSSSEGSNCASSPGASEKQRWLQWLEQVELYTSLWRRRRAARYRLKAANHWHRARVEGQEKRFERIAECGAVRWMLERHDGQGTTARPLKSRCDCWRICRGCLDRRKWKLSTGIMQQRERAFALHARQRARWYGGAEGRWSERLLTLTVPHGDSPGSDARMLTRGWRELSRRIARHMREDRGAAVSPVWVRAMEVAPSQAGGHAHLHVWWFGPFIDHAWLRATWGAILERMGAKVPRVVYSEALRKSVDKRFKVWVRTRRGQHGRSLPTVPWPVVDVRSGRDAGAAQYAQKVGVVLYVSKGAKEATERLHPLHAATVYEALESARCVQWCRGWAPPRRREPGVSWSLRRLSEEERAQLSREHEASDRALCKKIDALAALAHASPAEPHAPASRAPPEQLSLV